MAVSAFKSPAEVATTPPTWLPQEPRFENFYYAVTAVPFGFYFLNSLITTCASVSITAFTAILAAFAFSRLRFPGRDMLFAFSLTLMMIPFEMLIITNYSTMAALRMIDTLGALILPFCASIFYTYILRNFFMSVPDSLYWAARTDGAGNWKFLWRILVPLGKPAIVTIVLLNTIISWNSFIWPLLVISSNKKRTLSLGLYAFITDGGVRYERLMAAATLVVIPVIILFLAARKHIISGVARGGLKG
jgi:multiple sugar transport system permease protein